MQWTERILNFSRFPSLLRSTLAYCAPRWQSATTQIELNVRPAVHLWMIDVGTRTNASLKRGIIAPHDSIGNVATGGTQLDDDTE
jgi:hypothetical protein